MTLHSELLGKQFPVYKRNPSNPKHWIISFDHDPEKERLPVEAKLQDSKSFRLSESESESEKDFNDVLDEGSIADQRQYITPAKMSPKMDRQKHGK